MQMCYSQIYNKVEYIKDKYFKGGNSNLCTMEVTRQV